jgi:hypothetical protein
MSDICFPVGGRLCGFLSDALDPVEPEADRRIDRFQAVELGFGLCKGLVFEVFVLADDPALFTHR